MFNYLQFLFFTLMVNIDEMLALHTSMVEQNSAQKIQEMQDKHTEELMLEKQRQEMKVAKEKEAAQFIGKLLQEGNATLEEVLQPEFLQVETIQQSVQEMCRALKILHEEATVDVYKKESTIIEAAHKKILAHLGWATEVKKRETSVWGIVPELDVTPTGKAVAQGYADHMGIKPRNSAPSQVVVEMQQSLVDRLTGRKPVNHQAQRPTDDSATEEKEKKNNLQE